VVIRSAVYTGTLIHSRRTPARNVFRYPVSMWLFDLDELPELERRLALFSVNRRNVVTLRDRDHFDGTAPLKQAVLDLVDDPSVERVLVLTQPRVLGYVFNPVSFYFVRRRSDDALQLVLAEVHNTHGEEHVYDLARTDESHVYTSRADKMLYVSPFIDMDARYVFECHERPGGRYDLRIDEYQHDELFFQAQLTVAPRPLTNRNVAWMLARYPFMTVKTIGLIHWQGLKLWLRGVKYQPNPRKEAKR
jgi:uncharacterized protein